MPYIDIRAIKPGQGWAERGLIVGSRHRKDGSTLVQEKEDELYLRPDKSLRSMEHRKVRHRVGNELHSVDDPDAAVFTKPQFDHPPRVSKGKKAPRHWKLKAWKRRTAERHRRNEERRALLDDLE